MEYQRRIADAHNIETCVRFFVFALAFYLHFYHLVFFMRFRVHTISKMTIPVVLYRIEFSIDFSRSFDIDFNESSKQKDSYR